MYAADILIASKNKTHIQKLKAHLKVDFDMKDLGETKKILGMKISGDKSTCRLWLSQENYILRMFKMFNMVETKPVTALLEGHFRLFFSQCLNSQEEDEMS